LGVLSELLYWGDLFEASCTGAAKVPEAVLETIATQNALLVLLAMVVSKLFFPYWEQKMRPRGTSGA
jgi:hypothetical protein